MSWEGGGRGEATGPIMEAEGRVVVLNPANIRLGWE